MEFEGGGGGGGSGRTAVKTETGSHCDVEVSWGSWRCRCEELSVCNKVREETRDRCSILPAL